MRPINRYLNPQLMGICHQVVHLEELNLKLYQYLPETLHEHCHVSSFNKGCLNLITTDSVWASQLRYCIPELRDKLRSEAGIYRLSSIKISIATEKPTVNIPKVEQRQISPNARNAIFASAEQCGYQPLKEALLNLSKA